MELDIRISEDKFQEENGQNGNSSERGAQIYGIRDILVPYLNRVLSEFLERYVKRIEVEIENGLVIYIPYDELEERIWIPEWSFSLIKIDFIGYTLLTKSRLARYANRNLNPIYRAGVACITIAENEKLQKEGYFSLPPYITYSFTLMELNDAEYLREICALFSIELIDTEDISNWVLSPPFFFPLLNWETWLRESVSRVKRGEFPSWSFSVEKIIEDEEKEYGYGIYRKYFVKYAALLALSELGKFLPLSTFPFFSTFTSSLAVDIEVNLPYVTVPLPTLEHCKKYEELFFEIYNREFQFEICENILDGVLKRYALRDTKPIFFNFSKQGNEGKQICIYTSKEIKNIPDEGDDLKLKMIEYFRICHDNYEIVEGEDIDEMSLEDIITLIPITEDGISYCFKANNIQKLNSHPITRSPISENVKRQADNIQYNLRGYYDLGPLPGLFRSPSEDSQNADIHYLEEKINKISMTKVVREKEFNFEETEVSKDVLEKERSLLGSVFLVSVVVAEPTRDIDLFRISLPRGADTKVLRDTVQSLWSKGFFLNDWEKTVFLIRGKITNVVLNHSILLEAASDIYNGEKALRYLVRDTRE